MKHLDLFCGYGGWTDGFLAEGFLSVGIDNNIKCANKYKGIFVEADLMDYEPEGYYDVITASPPCTEFSKIKKAVWGDQNEMKGLDCVYRAFYLIQKLKPRFWIVENVPGLAQLIGPPKHKVQYAKSGKWAYLYGEFPELGLFDCEIKYHNNQSTRDPNKRGLIPFQLSNAYAKVIKNNLVHV